MADAAVVGVFDKSTNTTTPVDQSVSWASPNFTPKLLRLSVSNQTAHGTSSTVGETIAVGFTDGTNERCVAVQSEEAVGTTNCSRICSDTKLLEIYDDAGSLLAECDFKSFDSKGFTITWTTNNAVALKIHYWAVGGSDITDVAVTDFTLNTGTGSQAVSSLSFQPDALMFLSTSQTAFNSLGDNSILTSGMAVSSTEECVSSLISVHNLATSDTGRSQRIDACLDGMSDGTTREYLCDFTSMDANGFTINISDAPAAAYKVIVVAIKGGSWFIGSDTVPVTDTTKAFTGVGFQPNTALFQSFQNSVDTGVNNNGRISLGAADNEINEACVSITDRDNRVTSETYATNSVTRLQHYIAANGTANGEANMSAWDADGFTLNWVNTVTDLKEFVFLAGLVTDTPSTVRRLIFY
jgi:hypothetical protein